MGLFRSCSCPRGVNLWLHFSLLLQSIQRCDCSPRNYRGEHKRFARGSPSRSARQLQLLTTRGGEDILKDPLDKQLWERYTSVGIIPVGVKHGRGVPDVEAPLVRSLLPSSAFETSLVLASDWAQALSVDDSCRLSKASLPNDASGIEALCMICDFIVLWMPDPSASSISHREWVTALVKGVKRRRQAGLDKLQVLILLRSAGELVGQDPSLESVESSIVLDEEVQRITPQHVDRLEVIDLDNTEHVATVWKGLLKEAMSAERKERLVDYKAVGPLMESIYRALSSKSCTVRWEPVPGFIGKTDSQEDEDDMKEHPHMDEDILVQEVIHQAELRLEELEQRQEDVWLNPDHVPLLEFGQEANAILQHASDTVEQNTPPGERVHVLQQVVLSRLVSGKLRVLYDQQLQSLREHYGRQYELALDASNDQQEWTEAAQKATELFRVAAQEAIPERCREGGDLRDEGNYSYVLSLQGLTSDMMEATSQKEDYLEAAVASDDVEEDNEGAQPKRPRKWYHKLAARAAVLAVNYFQGWLALNAIRRAAAERDRDMPKFPLF